MLLQRSSVAANCLLPLLLLLLLLLLLRGEQMGCLWCLSLPPFDSCLVVYVVAAEVCAGDAATAAGAAAAAADVGSALTFLLKP